MPEHLKKVIKPMYLFFDYLYESIESIPTNVDDWKYKDKPVLKYCVLKFEDKDTNMLPRNEAVLFNTYPDAHKFLIEEEYRLLENNIYIWE